MNMSGALISGPLKSNRGGRTKLTTPKYWEKFYKEKGSCNDLEEEYLCQKSLIGLLQDSGT